MATKKTASTKSAPKKTRDWKPGFLGHLARTGNIGHSCRAAGVDRKTFYKRRDADPAFAALAAEALELACDDMELEARRRGRDGVDKPVIYKGELMGLWVDADGNVVGKDAAGARCVPLTVKEYSDVLLMFLLKAHRPDKFRDNVRHEHGGVGGDPIRHDHAHRIDLDEFRKLPLDEMVRILRAPPAAPQKR